MKRRNRTITIVVLAAAILVIGLHFSGLIRPLRSLTDQITSPVGRFLRRITSSTVDGVRLVGSIGSINSENDKLSAQVDDLKKQLAQIKEVQRENDLLRAQLGVAPTGQYNLAAARVLGGSGDSVRSVLQIDKGSSAGIREGMAVISGAGLVGVVDSVDSFSAKVLSINDPVFKISAIAQDSRATGIVRGQLGTGLKMEKISQNEPIKTGETIITAGSGLVPKGLIIGEVENIDRVDNAIFQGADIKPSVNIAKIELVFVIMGVK